MMNTAKYINPKGIGQTPIASSSSRLNGFVMLEVLMAMTILAIAGTYLMRSLTNSIEASKMIKDTTKAIYLTQAKLHDLELQYTNRADPLLGELRGQYQQPGASKFSWIANVEIDRVHDAYVITVWTIWGDENPYRRISRRYRDRSDRFMLKTMVPRARFNEDLVMGIKPTQRQSDQLRNSRRRGGRRGR